MAAAPKRTPRLRPEVRRRQILDATLVAARDVGFSDLTVDAVAREAGITRPVVYDLFGDLDGLLAALVDDAESRALAGVTGALPQIEGDERPDEVLVASLKRFLKAVQADPLTWRLMLLPPEGAPAAIRERTAVARKELAGHIAVLLEWWAARADALAGIDCGQLARTLVAVGEDLARLVLEKPRRYPPERVAASAGPLVRLIPLDR